MFGFSLSLVRFEAICNDLQHITVIFIKNIYTDTFLRKPMVTSGNLLQIAQNQANLTENIQ